MCRPPSARSGAGSGELTGCEPAKTTEDEYGPRAGEHDAETEEQPDLAGASGQQHRHTEGADQAEAHHRDRRRDEQVEHQPVAVRPGERARLVALVAALVVEEEQGGQHREDEQ